MFRPEKFYGDYKKGSPADKNSLYSRSVEYVTNGSLIMDKTIF